MGRASFAMLESQAARLPSRPRLRRFKAGELLSYGEIGTQCRRLDCTICM